MSPRVNSPERAWLCEEHRHARTEILTIGHMGNIPCDLCGKTPAELVQVTLSIYAPLDVGIGFVSTGQAWANPRWREALVPPS